MYHIYKHVRNTYGVIRNFYLVENPSTGNSVLFYTSSGTCTPGIKSSGEIFPIAGVSGVGKLGARIAKLHPTRSSGWIAKAVTDGGRRDIASYYGKRQLQESALSLEAVARLIPDAVGAEGMNEAYGFKFKVLTDRDFFVLVDYFHEYRGDRFFPNLVLAARSRELLARG